MAVTRDTIVLMTVLPPFVTDSGEARTIIVNLPSATNVEFRLLFSDDGPGPTDQVEIKAGDQTRILGLEAVS